MAADSRSSQIRLARIDNLGVGKDVDQGRSARLEGTLESRPQLAGIAHENAVAAKRLDQLVVAGLRPQLCRDRVAVEELHRMVLERPDPVVAHDADHSEAVTSHRVELHSGKAEGAVAEQ